MAEARARVVVPAPAPFVYGHLSAMELHPKWMTDLMDVRRTGPRRRRWELRGPAGPVGLDVEITVDQPARRFGFCMEGPGIVGYTMARIYESGATTGLAVDRGFHARHPALAAWWGDPDRRLRRDLWRFCTTIMHGQPVAPPTETAAAPERQGSSDLTRSLSGPSNASLFSN